MPLTTTPAAFLNERIHPYEPEAWIASGRHEPQLGCAFDFRAFDTDRIRSEAIAAGLEAVPSIAVIDRVTRLSPQSNDRDTFGPAIYIPVQGLGPAVTSPSELAGARTPHLCLHLREDAPVTADYLSDYLNSPPGVQFRRNLAPSSTLQSIPARAWSTATFFLPPTAKQHDITELSRRIQTMHANLSALSLRLWKEPSRTNELAGRLHLAGRDHEPSAWLDLVPFPLASILWAASQERSNLSQKATKLDHFFEATAEFTAIVLLSGFRNDTHRFDQQRRDLIRHLDRFHQDLHQPSFGTWVKIVEPLAKELRVLLREDATAARVRTAFRVATNHPLQALCDPRVTGILQEANALRNRYRGHGGAQDEVALKARCAAFESLVGKYREATADAWATWPLVTPGANKYRAGIHHTEAHSLMGPRTPFASTLVRLRDPAEDGDLHLFDPESELALRILPLVQMRPSPPSEQNACYFYNQEKNGSKRLVSYHLGSESEITNDDASLAEAVDLLRNDPT